MLRRRPGGPQPVQRPDATEGVPDVSAKMQAEFEDNHQIHMLIVDALATVCHYGVECNYEQPPSALSMREKFVQ